MSKDVTNSIQEEGVSTLFCNIGCIEYAVKYVCLTRETLYTKDWTEEKEILFEKYYTKESPDINILIDFILATDYNYEAKFVLSVQDIKTLLENSGGFFSIKRNEKIEGKHKVVTKYKIQLKPIELKHLK